MKTESELRLITEAEYVTERPQVFPSLDSLRWFYRQHHAELIAAGAVLMPTGRKVINPVAFDSALVEIGKRLAAKRSNPGR